MTRPKLSRLELQIMEALWTRGPCSVREIQESFPARKRPAYTTVQTTVYRLETKKALRRVKKIATALIFEAAVSREAAERRLVDDLLALFGGRSRPIVAHLVESGSLTLADVREAEKALLKLAGEEKPE
ncbi:MAG TPA: BlaI/MecI/CopY family transcriptional regulator [Bryobacteraceae bacterium]|nr:BlaI/MecI/CopY family transcriptional regulator [Bryobacteraceae bacterium]